MTVLIPYLLMQIQYITEISNVQLSKRKNNLLLIKFIKQSMQFPTPSLKSLCNFNIIFSQIAYIKKRKKKHN